jgi:hypothetical protein
MKEQFVKYLETIGVSGPLLAHVDGIYSVCQQLIPTELEAIFLSDYVQEDGSRWYDFLWFFSPGYALAVPNLRDPDVLDVLATGSGVAQCTITRKAYDLANETSDSRLHVKLRLADGPQLELRASRENCRFLRDIVRQYFLANHGAG